MAPANDTEILRSKLKEAPHLGILHLRNGKCLIRCDKTHLAAVRKAVSPGDPRYAMAPEVEARRKWIIHDVPSHISPLRLSTALASSMGWRQIPLGAYKKNARKSAHEVHIGADSPPSADTVVLEGKLCLIKEHRAVQPPSEVQPKMTPPTAVASMEVEEEESAGVVMERKMKIEVKAARDALQAAASTNAQQEAATVEQKVLARVDAKIKDFDDRMQKMEKLHDEMATVKKGCQETHNAVQELHRSYMGIEPMLERKVQEASKHTAMTLNATLEAKFDALGQQLMMSLSSMAKKREGDVAMGSAEKHKGCPKRKASQSGLSSYAS